MEKITPRDLAIAKALKRNPSKATFSTDTSFTMDTYLYNKDEVLRQKEAFKKGKRVTYEDHMSVINTAKTILKKDTQLSIAKAILTHRYFKDYRINTFKGQGNYLKDLQFILLRVGNIFDAKTTKVKAYDTSETLKKYLEPTLIQINYLAKTTSKVILPTDTKLSLQEWAEKFNRNASETTTYTVIGI